MNYFVGKDILLIDIEKLSNEKLLCFKDYILKKQWKSAAHLIRLLRMAIEFLIEGKLYVERKSDATELLDIKTGKWTLEKVIITANKLFELCETAYVNSSLPNEPDINNINNTCIGILRDYITTKGGL